MEIPKQQSHSVYGQESAASNNTLTDAPPVIISIYAGDHFHPAQPFNNMDAHTMGRGEGCGVGNDLDSGCGVTDGVDRERVDIVVDGVDKFLALNEYP